jgi:hypothetical protein
MAQTKEFSEYNEFKLSSLNNSKSDLELSELLKSRFSVKTFKMELF